MSSARDDKNKVTYTIKDIGSWGTTNKTAPFRVSDEELAESAPPVDVVAFEPLFGHRFSDSHLLEVALTHRSMQINGEYGHYERLEFLGDAVLDLAIAELLIEAHPQASEGELSKMRAALVNTTNLARIARNIGLGKFIRLSRGEHIAGGSDRSSILADVIEAVLGALFRELGYSQVRDAIGRLFGDLIQTVSPSDPKTELQERLHALSKGSPNYHLEATEGPEHSPTFISVVLIDDQIMGRGQGTTKKLSQQAAAAEALSVLVKNK